MATIVTKQQLAALSNARDEKTLVVTLNALIDAIRVVTAKLDADAGVTDTNYTALFDAVITK